MDLAHLESPVECHHAAGVEVWSSQILDVVSQVQGCGRTDIDTTGREPCRVSSMGIGRGVVLRID